MSTRSFLLAILLISAMTRSQSVEKKIYEMSYTELVQFIEQNSPSEEAFVAVQRLASGHIQERNWSEADSVFKKFAPNFPDMAGRFQAIIDLLLAPEITIEISNLGAGINTEYAEYCPVLSLDGTALYFTSYNREGGVGSEDIYVSMRQADGSWGAAELVSGEINTRNPEAVLAISPDQTMLLIFGNYPGSLGHGDAFYAEKTAEGWSTVRHLGPPISSEHFEAAAFISADGHALFIESDRPGGVGEHHPKDDYFDGHSGGNLDIWVSIRNDAGWAEPINLGDVVNTPFAERMPFLTADGRTLIFSSDGHYGLGGGDLFKCERLSDTSWTEWSEPINLGKAYNTAGEDWGYKLSADGQTAYFAGPSENGDSDIYSIDFDITVETTIISGIVKDSTGAPLAALIVWEDLETGKVIGELRSDPQTGRYTISLPNGKLYGYYATVPNSDFYPVSQRLDLRDKTGFGQITVDIVMGSFIANNILFDFDSDVLRPESMPELRRLAEYLLGRPDRNVEIQGYTCDMGTDAYNLSLSRRRAASVVAALVQLNVPKIRLTSKGYGKANPRLLIEPGDSDEIIETKHEKNRRVEFRLL